MSGDEPLPTFEAPDLARRVEALSPQARDTLPFGAVELDAMGRVLYFSAVEARQSGFHQPTDGRGFFTTIAPCMNTPHVRGRLDQAMREGRVDLEVGWHGDYRDEDAFMRIRAQSSSRGGVWLFLNREPG